MHDDPTMAALDRIARTINGRMNEMNTTGSLAQLNGLVAACSGKLEMLRVRLLGAGCSATIDQSAKGAVLAILGSSIRAPHDTAVACDLCDPLEEVAAARLAEIAEALGREQATWQQEVVGPLSALRARYMAEIASNDPADSAALGFHSSHDRMIQTAHQHVLEAWEKMLDLLRGLKEFQANPLQRAQT